MRVIRSFLTRMTKKVLPHMARRGIEEILGARGDQEKRQCLLQPKRRIRCIRGLDVGRFVFVDENDGRLFVFYMMNVKESFATCVTVPGLEQVRKSRPQVILGVLQQERIRCSS